MQSYIKCYATTDLRSPTKKNISIQIVNCQTENGGGGAYGLRLWGAKYNTK